MAARGTLRTARDRIRSPGTTSVLIGSVLSGLGAYVFQVLGTRSLGDEAYAPIGVLWTIQYLSLTVVLVSVEAYLTRTITLYPDSPWTVRRAALTLFGWITAVAALVGMAAWIWREPLFHGAGGDLALLAALIVLGYGLLVLARGHLAGTGRFGAYGFATGGESLVRLVAALPVAAFFATTRSLAWTLPAGAFTMTAWWVFAGRKRPTSRPPADEPSTGATLPMPRGATGRYLAATTTAYAASQTLLAAGPLVLVPLAAGPAEISVFFITITAARVPLVLAFGGVLSRVLPALTRAAQAGEMPRLQRLATTIAAMAALTGMIGAAAGAWIGPEVVALFFGEAFTPAGWFVALTVAGVTLATAALGLGQILIAMGRELRLVAPWLLGLGAGAVCVVVLQGSPTLRVAVGFAVGEALALTGLLIATLTAQIRHPAPADRSPVVGAETPGWSIQQLRGSPMPAVTVVIPTRDRTRLLLQTLRSVQRQRNVDLEVLVVDDGSVEDICGFVSSIGDPRIHVLRHQQPLGVSTARNRGIHEARGPWVAFLDDDDLWAPDKLAAQLAAVRQDSRTWCVTGAVSIDDSLKVLAGEHPLLAEDMVTDLRRYNSVPVGASNVLADQSLLERVGGFDPTIRHMSDWDMWIRLGTEGLPAVVDRPLVGYRLHAGAATMDTAVDPDEPLAEFDTIVQRYGIAGDRAAVHRWIAWTALRRGHRQAALRAYLAAIRDGDLRSIVRLGIALVHPGVGKRVFFRPLISQDDALVAEAESWLSELASEAGYSRSTTVEAIGGDVAGSPSSTQ